MDRRRSFPVGTHSGTSARGTSARPSSATNAPSAAAAGQQPAESPARRSTRHSPAPSRSPRDRAAVGRASRGAGRAVSRERRRRDAALRDIDLDGVRGIYPVAEKVRRHGAPSPNVRRLARRLRGRAEGPHQRQAVIARPFASSGRAAMVPAWDVLLGVGSSTRTSTEAASPPVIAIGTTVVAPPRKGEAHRRRLARAPHGDDQLVVRGERGKGDSSTPPGPPGTTLTEAVAVPVGCAAPLPNSSVPSSK